MGPSEVQQPVRSSDPAASTETGSREQGHGDAELFEEYRSAENHRWRSRLEVKALLAGVEYMQVWINQAGKLAASIASDALQVIQRDRGSISETASRLTEFGVHNAEVFSDLSSRMRKNYYNELGRLVTAVDTWGARKVWDRSNGCYSRRRALYGHKEGRAATACTQEVRAQEKGWGPRRRGTLWLGRRTDALHGRTPRPRARCRLERRATNHTAGSTLRLIGSGHYRESAGSPHDATHFRRSLSDGSCLHLGSRKTSHGAAPRCVRSACQPIRLSVCTCYMRLDRKPCLTRRWRGASSSCWRDRRLAQSCCGPRPLTGTARS